MKIFDKSFGQRKAGVLLSNILIFFTSAASILLTPLMIVHLGKAEYGLYQLISTFAGYLLLFDFGTSAAATRFVAKYRALDDREGLHSYIKTALIIILSLLTAMIIIGFAVFLNLGNIFSSSLNGAELKKADMLFVFFLFNGVFTLADRFFDGFVTAYEHFAFSGGLKLTKLLFRTSVVAVLLLVFKSSVLMTAADASIALIFLAADVFYCKKRLKLPLLQGKFNKQLFTQSLGFSFFIFLQALVNQININTDKLILGIMSNIIIINICFNKKIGLNIPRILKNCFKGILPCLILTSAVCSVFLMFKHSSWLLFLAECFIFISIYCLLLWHIGLNKSEKEMLSSLVSFKSPLLQ